MRECPSWFQAELTRLGGVNQYGDPIFKLVWSASEQMTVGGRWKDGFSGYKRAPLIPGEQCWALLVWEPAEVSGGSYEAWERDFRDPETGLLQVGGYPKYGAYRLLQRFLHREIVRQPIERHWMGKDGTVYTDVLQRREMRSYRMEPCGLMLDIMLPMLMAWKRLSNSAKIAALRQQEQQRKDEFTKRAKDIREGTRLSRTMRSSQLVQKRAELIEQGMKQAMAKAVQWGLGLAIGA